MSQTNQKLTNQLESFFNDNQANNNYLTKEFKLKENFADCILVKNSPGGSSGGDCWDGRTSDYSNSQEEQISEITSEIKYKLKSLSALVGLDEVIFNKVCSDKAHEIQCAEIGSDTDDSDYYGNYTNYNIFKVNIISFFKAIVENTTENKKIKKNFDVLAGFAADFKQEEDILHIIKVKNEKEKELTDKMKNFSTSREKVKIGIQNSISQYRKVLASLVSQLDDFDQVSIKEFKNLNDELKNIQKSNSNPSDLNKKTNKIK